MKDTEIYDIVRRIRLNLGGLTNRESLEKSLSMQGVASIARFVLDDFDMLIKGNQQSISLSEIRSINEAMRLQKEMKEQDPVSMLLWCPECGKRHIDEGEFATKHHHTHACQFCGHIWRPAIRPTFGVQFLPGFKNEVPK